MIPDATKVVLDYSLRHLTKAVALHDTDPAQAFTHSTHALRGLLATEILRFGNLDPDSADTVTISPAEFTELQIQLSDGESSTDHHYWLRAKLSLHASLVALYTGMLNTARLSRDELANIEELIVMLIPSPREESSDD